MALTTPSTAYEEHRDYVLGVLGRRCGWLDPSDREALFHDAYALFLEKQRDGQLDAGVMRSPQVRAYLTQTALNKAMDEGKRAGRRRSVSLDDDELGLEPVDPGRGLDERLASRLDDARVREIVAELPERQQIVIKLRFFFNRSPQEIQRFLGVTDRVYRRELERATRQLAARFELVVEGTYCESRRSLILAYVTGVAGPTRTLAARRHLDSCPACGHWASELRFAIRSAAAVLPLPPLAMPLQLGLAGGSHSALRAARERITELVTSGRAHALRAAVRGDPSRAVALTTTVRPGTMAVVLAGCLAAGSTTYCVVEGLPASIRSLVGVESPPRHPTPLPRASRENRVLAVSKHVSPTAPRRRATRIAWTVTRPRPDAHRSAAAPATTSAQRVHVATSPEFGVGNGQPLPPPRAAIASAPRPPPARPLPEFDP